jgi:Clp amino terminal domain, pathogenicity island component/UvrB/uvrC motif
VFERFTERARQVVVLAQDEARGLRHNYIGTEHILLGLLREEEGLAARVLESLDITIEEVRAQVARIVGRGDEVTTGQIPFTPRAKKVLELSLREAISLGHGYIGTEHVLLGLVRENEGVAARILLDFDADPERVREEVFRMLSGPGRRLELQASAEPTPLTTPPIAAEYLDELETVREQKERAIHDQDFQRAAKLRDRERRLQRAAQRVQRLWAGRDEPVEELDSQFEEAQWTGYVPPPRGTSTLALLIAAIVGASIFGVGLLIGWLIWG